VLFKVMKWLEAEGYADPDDGLLVARDAKKFAQAIIAEFDIHPVSDNDDADEGRVHEEVQQYPRR
jgi:hypothetical protein